MSPSEASSVDVITQNVGENVRREQARDLAASVVQAVFRLVKNATLHAIDNQAVVRQVEETVSLVQDFGHRSGYSISILFAHGSIFVSGQLLKANRSVYEGAIELGDLLKRCGYSELGISRDVRAADLFAFASAIAEALRSGKALPERPAQSVRLRAVGDAVLRRETAIDRIDDEAAAMVRAYATAIVIMRRFYEDLRHGRYVLRQGIKRITQRLVDLSAGETPAFLGVTALRNQNHDEAGRAVNTAILSLAMARQVTTDVVLLGRLGMAALLLDTARPRLTGVARGQSGTVVPQLSEQQEAEVPAGTAVVLTALGLVNEPSVMRTVIAYEAHWVKRQAVLGPIYRGLRQPTLQARIIAAARTFNDLLTPAPGQAPLSADDAIATLTEEASDPAERTVLRLLVGALGIFPTGTLVELSTGEVALVIQTPSHPALYSQPRVRLVLDAAGGPIQRPLDAEIDLAERPRPGEPARYVRRIVATSDDPAAASMRAHALAQEAAQPPLRPPVAIHEEPAIHGYAGATQPPQSTRGVAQPQGGDPRAQSPTVRPGKRTAAASEAPPIASPLAVEEPFAPSDSYLPPALDLGSVAAKQLAALHLPEQDAHGQVTRALAWEDQDFALDLEQAELEPLEDAPSARPGPTVLELPDGQPAADGTLKRTPLVHLFVYMLDRRLTGSTCFVDPGGVVHGIFFNDGVPAKVWTGTMVAPLDRVILDMGLLDEATLRDTLREVSKRHVLHGRHLVSRGLLDRETVLKVLREQNLRKLIALFDLPPETRYLYYDSLNVLEGYGGPELLECEPLALIIAGIRVHPDDPLIDATLERISNRQLGLHLDAEMKPFELHSDEAAVVDLLRTRRMTLGEMIGAGVAQERVIRLTIYALAITRHLDLGAPGRGPVGLGRDRRAPAERAGVVIRETQRPGAQPPSASRTPMPRTARSTPEAPARPARRAEKAARPDPRVEGSAPPEAAQADEAFDEQPTPSSKRLGDAVAMPRGIDVRGPNSPRTLTSPGAPSAPPQAPTVKISAVDRKRLKGVGRPETSPPPATNRSAVAPPEREEVPPAPITERRPDAAAIRPEILARRAEIEARFAAIEGEDYFQVLGLTPDAPPDRIQGAYFALAKQWHPDRTPPELQDFKPKITRIFARISEAYQTLNDPTRRAEYLAEKEGAGGDVSDEEAQVARAVDAAFQFQKAEVLLKKRDLDGALELARRAADADPDQPEYVTLLAWIQAQRRGEPPPFPEGGTSKHFDDLIDVLNAVLKKEPAYERALFYRAVLLKRSGHAQRALRDFRQVAEINPKNIDAVREVRLHEMRKRSRDEPQPPQGGSPGGGLLGKFFKR